jgi:hypothetical protein
MNADYQYEENSRRPITILGLAITCVMVGVAQQHGAPWFFLTPVVCTGAMFVWMIVAARRSGMRLLGQELHLYAGKWIQTVPVTTITFLEVKDWIEGAPTVSLALDDGSTVHVPGYCIGSAKDFEAAMLERGIPVHQT